MPTIQIRIDDKTKTASKALFTKLGISMSEAINLFLRQAIIKKGIPFSITTVPEQNETELPGGEAFLDALKRYKAINNKNDFNIEKAEPFFTAIDSLGSDTGMRITLQENAVKAKLNYNGKEYVLDYNFEEPDSIFVLKRKDGKLFVKDCHISKISEVLGSF